MKHLKPINQKAGRIEAYLAHEAAKAATKIFCHWSASRPIKNATAITSGFSRATMRIAYGSNGCSTIMQARLWVLFIGGLLVAVSRRRLS